MFVIQLARSYGILRPEIMGYLSGGASCRVVKAKSLKQMEVVMELGDGIYVWFVLGGADDKDEDDEEQGDQDHEHGGDESYEVGSADYY